MDQHNIRYTLDDVMRNAMRRQRAEDMQRYQSAVEAYERAKEAWRWNAAVTFFGVVFMVTGFTLAYLYM